MGRILDIKNSFVTGEISPLLLGRTDLAKYSQACELVQNFITRIQGGLSRRPGLKYFAKVPGPGRLIPFIFSSDQSYILLITEDPNDPPRSSIAVFKNGEQIFVVDSAPWLVADDFELIKYTQIGDTMYLVHPLYPVQKLNRLNEVDWVLNQPKFHSAPATQQDQDISGGTNGIIAIGPVVPSVNEVSLVLTSRFLFIGNSFGSVAAPTDVGKQIISGTGVATILSLAGNPIRQNKIVNNQVVGWQDLYYQAQVAINFPFTQNQYPGGAWSVNGRFPAAIMDINSTQVGVLGDMSITLNDPAFIRGDIGKQIVAGTGIGLIVGLGGITDTDPCTGATRFGTANIVVIDTFDLPDYQAGSWFLRGSPGSYFAPGNIQVITGKNAWFGSKQFGLGSQVPVRTLSEHPTDYSFQESTGTAYVHVFYTGTFIDTFRPQDIGRYVAFSGGYGQIISLGTAAADPVTGLIPDGSTAAVVSILSPPKATESDAQGNLLIAVAFPGSWFFDDVAFTEANGYPAAVCFFQSRLWFGGTVGNPQTVWGSVIEDFENFAKGTLDDDGIEIVLSSGVFDKILWMQPYLGNIIAGSSRGEYTVGGGGNADVGQNTTPITPTNATAVFQSAYGVTTIQAQIIQEALFYVQRLQLNVYSMEFNIQTASYDSKDMSLLNNLITKTPFIEMAYQQNQIKVIWFIAANEELTEDGNLIGKYLIGLTYDKNETVAGWHRHFSGAPLATFSDSFISMAVIPNNVNGAIVDELWVMMLRKDVDESKNVYTLELMDTSLNVDYATHLISTVPVTQITGLGYLNGKIVHVVADGALLPSVVMDSGGIYTFPPGFTALDVQAGLNYLSRAITVRPETRGTAQGIIKRWNIIWIRIFESLGLTVNGQLIPNRVPENLMNEAVPLFTGDERIMDPGYDRDGRVLIEQLYPLPAEVLAMFGQLQIGEN